jgi:DNA-binding CsgD family transcriptional regulator
MADAQQAAEAAARVGAENRAQFLVDDDGVCVEASLGLSRLLERSREDLIGLSLPDLLEPASAARLDQVWREARDRGGQLGFFRLRAPAAAEHVAVSVTPSVLPGRHIVRLEPGVAAAEPGIGPPEQVRMLSARESQVLALLTQGASDREIARSLGLSPATVQTHVRNAKSKLGARTRAHAVAIAIQRGLINPDPPGGQSES